MTGKERMEWEKLFTVVCQKAGVQTTEEGWDCSKCGASVEPAGEPMALSVEEMLDGCESDYAERTGGLEGWLRGRGWTVAIDEASDGVRSPEHRFLVIWTGAGVEIMANGYTEFVARLRAAESAAKFVLGDDGDER